MRQSPWVIWKRKAGRPACTYCPRWFCWNPCRKWSLRKSLWRGKQGPEALGKWWSWQRWTWALAPAKWQAILASPELRSSLLDWSRSIGFRTSSCTLLPHLHLAHTCTRTRSRCRLVNCWWPLGWPQAARTGRAETLSDSSWSSSSVSAITDHINSVSTVKLISAGLLNGWKGETTDV